MRPSLGISSAIVALALAGAASAAALSIEAGPKGELARDVMCPRLEAALKRARLDYECRESGGAAEHLKGIEADPRYIAMGPLDALAAAVGNARADDRLTIIRSERPQACLLFVTRAPGITGSGELAAWAGKLKLIVSGGPSGAAAALAFLRQGDPDGFGKAPAPVIAKSGEDAVRRALAGDDAAALLVEVPDAQSPTLTLVRELGGRVVPLIDRGLLAREIAGLKVYVSQEVEVAAGSWSTAPTRVATMCSPIGIYTGALDRVPPGPARQDHADVMAVIATLEPDALLPEDDRLKRLMKRARDLTGASVEEALRLSEEARIKAGPYVEKAIAAGKEAIAAGKEAAKEAAEAARPMVAKAKELSARALERAREELKEFLDDIAPPDRKQP